MISAWAGWTSWSPNVELEVIPDSAGGAPYRQRALFEPHRLAGHLSWKTIAPFHDIVFGGMVCNITGTAEHSVQHQTTSPRRPPVGQ
ncbi:MAG: DUF2867 domain-containing protein [Pseudonocardiaceae bacterium]